MSEFIEPELSLPGNSPGILVQSCHYPDVASADSKHSASVPTQYEQLVFLPGKEEGGDVSFNKNMPSYGKRAI